jgi:hypothetical protein
MRRSMMVGMFLFLLPVPPASTLPSAAAGQSSEVKPRTVLTVWDTSLAAAAVSGSALAGKNEWIAIPSGKTVGSFKGDAVLDNGRIVVSLHRQDSAVEVYAVKPHGVVARLRLRVLTGAGEPATHLERVALVQNTKGSACLEAFFKTATGADVSAKFRVKRGEVAVQTEPGAGAAKLRVECPGRFVVLPDFFADDIVIDATKLPLESVELPSENFVLHLTGQGEAIALCVFENRRQDVKVSLGGTANERIITGSEIGFEGKKIWVALMEAPVTPGRDGKVWHTHDVKLAEGGKIVPLAWKMPFPAQWRVDFSRPGDLTDSWEMLLQEKKGGAYTKPSWLGSGDQHLPPSRLRWNTVLGTYPYPCWSDPDGLGYLQPINRRVLQFQGPVVVYPINRVKETPLDVYTVVDLMRNTLGVGPCEHILDLEGQQSEYRGRATCGVRDKLTPIYAGKRQKAMRAEVDQTLDEGLIFVKHIRGRITRYVDFGHKMREYLAAQQKVHPELGEFIVAMDNLTQEIDKRMAARAAKIQTPEYVAKMNEEFRKNVLDYDGPDALQRCRQYTQALVVIGDNQDELSGECRWVVKTLRQRAGILMALDPRVAPIASEIRARTQEALRNPASHEGARH